jgi:hypothetical protein
MARYEYRMCKKCGYVLHFPILIKNRPGMQCFVCGKKTRELKRRSLLDWLLNRG